MAMKIYISEDEADDILFGDSEKYEKIKEIFVEKHRWYNAKEIIFKSKNSNKFYSVYYMEPATEYQEGQDCWETNSDGLIECHEVIEKEKVIKVYELAP